MTMFGNLGGIRQAIGGAAAATGQAPAPTPGGGMFGRIQSAMGQATQQAQAPGGGGDEASAIQAQIAQLQQRLQQLQSAGTQQPQQQAAAGAPRAGLGQSMPQAAGGGMFDNYAQALSGGPPAPTNAQPQSWGSRILNAGMNMGATNAPSYNAQSQQSAQSRGFNGAAQIGGGPMPWQRQAMGNQNASPQAAPPKSPERQQWEQWNQG